MDEFLVQLVRQRFNGNVSAGVNQVLKQHLLEERPKSMAGIIKGANLLEGWAEEEEREDAEEDRIYDAIGKKKRGRKA